MKNSLSSVWMGEEGGRRDHAEERNLGPSLFLRPHSRLPASASSPRPCPLQASNSAIARSHSFPAANCRPRRRSSATVAISQPSFRPRGRSPAAAGGRLLARSHSFPLLLAEKQDEDVPASGPTPRHLLPLPRDDNTICLLGAQESRGSPHTKKIILCGKTGNIWPDISGFGVFFNILLVRKTSLNRTVHLNDPRPLGRKSVGA